MGLDIAIRYRKVNSKPIEVDRWGNEVYADDDIINSELHFQGRIAFQCVREWVGDARYGRYIPLTKDNYDALMIVIEHQLSVDKEAYSFIGTDCPLDIEDTGFSLLSLYYLLLRAPFFMRNGWYMEIECDW